MRYFLSQEQETANCPQRQARYLSVREFFGLDQEHDDADYRAWCEQQQAEDAEREQWQRERVAAGLPPF